MIWVLIVLAALPLVMGIMMIFILRSGRLQQLQQQGGGRQAQTDKEGSDD